MCGREAANITYKPMIFALGLDLFCPEFWGVRKNFHRTCTGLRNSFAASVLAPASGYLLLYPSLHTINGI